MLSPGDRAIDFTRRDAVGEAHTFFERRCGEPRLLVVAPDGATPPPVAIPVFLLSDAAPNDADGWEAAMIDDGAVSRLYCGDAGPSIFAIDGRGRVKAAAPLDAVVDFNAFAEAALERPRAGHAPVLILPDVLDPTLAEALIAHFDAQGGEESGMLRESGDGVAMAIDRTAKARRDARIIDADLEQTVEARIAQRVLPEIQRAFAYRVERRELFKLVRYAADEGGWFRPHRDNTTPDAARRRFALTLNLNDRYGGGGVRFPEYDEQVLNPPAGGALAFSCSLLHEACAVTAGRRYALLTFFS